MVLSLQALHCNEKISFCPLSRAGIAYFWDENEEPDELPAYLLSD